MLILTETFKGKIISILRQINGVSSKQAEDIAEMKFADTQKLCRLMAYNETVDFEHQLAKQKKAILDDDCSLFDDDSLWTRIEKLGTARFNLYDGFADKHLHNPSGATIVRIGRELGMSTDDINSILSSYDRQTISFHRTDDLLFRYAVAKGWSYQRFVQELNFPDSEPNSTIVAKDNSVAKNDSWDSSFATRMNCLRLQQMCDSNEDWSEHPYQEIINTFQENERNANGAPRRTMLKLLGWLSTDYFNNQYPGNKKCRSKRVPSAFRMLCEMAALDVESVNQEEIVNCVISIVDKILTITYQPIGRQIPSLEKLNDLPGYDYALKFITLSVEREIRNRITDEKEKKDFSCDVNYILDILSKGNALKESLITSTTDREPLIRYQIVQNVLYRLLIVCDEHNVRENVAQKIKDDILPAFGDLFRGLQGDKQGDKIKASIWEVFWLKRRNERTSEPSRAFLILLALYTYGFSLAHPVGSENTDSIKKYISDILDSSGYIPRGNSLFDRTIIDLVEKITCYNTFPFHLDQRKDEWCAAVEEAWKHIAEQSNSDTIDQICQHSLTSGGWNYSELPKRGKGKKDTLESDRHDDSR